jgi:hypothetical protein
VQILWAVSCESFDLRDDGTGDIEAAGFDSFYVEELPILIELHILVRLSMSEGERGALDAHLLGPDPRERESLSFPVEADPGPHYRSGYQVTQIEPVEIRFQALHEGIYSVEIYTGAEAVTEDHRRSIFYYVRLLPA